MKKKKNQFINKTDKVDNSLSAKKINNVKKIKNNHYIKGSVLNNFGKKNINNSIKLIKKVVFSKKDKNTATPILEKKILKKKYKKKKIITNLYTKKLVKKKIFRKNKKIKDKNFGSYSEKKKIKFNKYPMFKKKNISLLHQSFKKPLGIVNKDIEIRESISILELAKKMTIKRKEIIKVLNKLGLFTSIEQIIDPDTAQLISEEMGYKVKRYYENELEVSIMKDRIFQKCIKKNRPPIVTIMGHVDHGKTSLLDYIRSSKIVRKEFGGITQHIGAYHVKTKKGIITFLDTPGHAAFTAMRARGVKITDIVVLVVAADDGIMPQTIEAIRHAQFAKVPIIVAINKIDKPNININKIKTDLIKYSIVSDVLGGENIFVEISAKTGKGINNLLSAILLQSEMMELSARINGMASGTIIESSVDKGKGPVSTVLIYEGTLKKGDIVICGTEYGKIKAITNEQHSDIISVGPSIPVKILGLSGTPIIGDELFVVNNERKARALTVYRKRKLRDEKFSLQKKSNIENLFQEINKKKELELNIILKTDVQGSLEAISESVLRLSNEKIFINIIYSGVGSITESDTSLCISSKAIIIGFNVQADISAKRIIELEKINVKYYSIIYNLINDIKSMLTQLLKPKHELKILGLLEVKNIFKSPKFGFIAGCKVKNGLIKKNNLIRILRDNLVLYEGPFVSLRRFKEDVSEVRSGLECGVGFKNFNNICSGDIFEIFENSKI